MSVGQCDKRLVKQAPNGRVQGGVLAVDLRGGLWIVADSILTESIFTSWGECFGDLLLGRGDLVDALATCRRDGVVRRSMITVRRRSRRSLSGSKPVRAVGCRAPGGFALDFGEVVGPAGAGGVGSSR